MDIVVLGAGAIGSVVAGYLTKAGESVALVGREDQVQAVQNNGLQVKGVRGEENFKIKILPRLDQEYDLVIFTVKTQDIEEAIKQNKSFLDRGIILSTQNGVRADHILSQYFLKGRLVSSIVMFGATYVKPGEVTLNFEGDWIIGRAVETETDSHLSAEQAGFRGNDRQIEEIAEILKKTFPIVISKNIVGMKYLKLFVNFNNCIPALVGKSMQETFADLDLCRLSILLLKEGVEIIQKAGIELTSMPKFPVERIVGLTQMPLDQATGIINKTLTSLSKKPLYGSILQSIMRGRHSEIDYINGEVVRLAKEKGLNAPLNEKIVTLVHRVEENREFLKTQEIKKEFDLNLEEVQK